MKHTIKFPVALLGLMLVMLTFGVASCDKDEPQPLATAVDQETLTLKSATCDTLHFSGTLLGNRYESVTIIFAHDTKAFSFEGDVVAGGETFHVSGCGDMETRTFNGVITDGDGHPVEITPEWVDLIFRPVEMLLKTIPQISAAVNA
ncbi:MAG: hypothetical protein IJ684_05995 [Bacteroidales bacterium]|nr:hypothetical protein [Bacteroidales bacterium]